MKNDDVLTMTNDSQYIEGVYNYCDRWCEHCPLTSRCLNYAIAEEDFGMLTEHDFENAAFWNKLQEMFEVTLEMLSEWAEEHGLNLDNIDMESAAETERQRREHTENHTLAQAAQAYGDLVDEWFDQEGAQFDQREAALKTIVHLGVGGEKPFDEARQINEAVEIVRWYQHQMHIKIMRALSQQLDGPDEAAELQSDANGSVKVALIGMDRSIAAWGTLRENFPDCADEILDLLIALDRLRRRTEQTFPHARAFVRPGFDSAEV